jgi:tRNA-splicing ligase RtcB (3'-phosphate/5'-hydroxy nucleic acid ligase)
MRGSRTHSGRFDNKTRQVCALAERAITLALAESTNPLLQSLFVTQVLPMPTIARLLVVVQPSVDVPLGQVSEILEALESNRGALRAELAAELNRKKTPELTFTLGSEEKPDTPEISLDRNDEPASWIAPPPPRLSFTSQHAGGTHLPKQERPRNEKRLLRREQRLAQRRGLADARDVPKTPSLFEFSQLEGAVPIKRWTRGVPVETEALQQLENLSRLSVVYPWVAAMPDVHLGTGATVGSVIPTRGAIIPAAVGVDIGCGMMAVRTSLTASNLPDSLVKVRGEIEKAVPHGRGRTGGRGDIGSWGEIPNAVEHAWKSLAPEYERLAEKHTAIRKANHVIHLGTLGTGNHFIELCLDEDQRLWVMLHSGSRGVGNRIGTYFIELAQRDMERHIKQLPHRDLAYFSEGSDHFYDYVRAVDWAQTYARRNRELMMQSVLHTLRSIPELPAFEIDKHAVNCHHNYVNRETHQGQELYVTRKGAVSAQLDELGIIPGSMGAQSFIVRGKGNPESFCSCSHGAGRRMSRTRARAIFTLEDHTRATQGVECRRDRDVLDETPQAYKDIGAVMAAQRDLVSIEHTLKQVVCIKG